MTPPTDSRGADPKRATPDEAAAIAINAVADAVSRLRYGAIGLTVHDGRVVQLEVTERQRFT
jgi:hypothetical protein